MAKSKHKIGGLFGVLGELGDMGGVNPHFPHLSNPDVVFIPAF